MNVRVTYTSKVGALSMLKDRFFAQGNNVLGQFFCTSGSKPLMIAK